MDMASTSESLLQRLRRPSDDAAWGRFVAIYTPLLHYTVLRAGVPEQDACDLIQDILIHLLRELPRFDYDRARGSFRGWLATVTANKCRERLRRKVFDQAEGGSADLFQTVACDYRIEDIFEEECNQHLVRRAMDLMQAEFEPRTWKACLERCLHGRPASDVARELGMTEAAVYVATSRVLRRLRHDLKGLLE